MILKHIKWRDVAFEVDKVENDVYHGQYININLIKIGYEKWPVIGVRDSIKINKKDFKDKWIVLKRGELYEKGTKEGNDKEHPICGQGQLEGIQDPVSTKGFEHNKGDDPVHKKVRTGKKALDRN